jgi:hypothetical protein
LCTGTFVSQLLENPKKVFAVLAFPKMSFETHCPNQGTGVPRARAREPVQHQPAISYHSFEHTSANKHHHPSRWPLKDRAGCTASSSLFPAGTACWSSAAPTRQVVRPGAGPPCTLAVRRDRERNPRPLTLEAVSLSLPFSKGLASTSVVEGVR